MTATHDKPGEQRAEEAMNDAGVPGGKRRVKLKWMKDIKPNRVRWLWQDLISCGTLTLIAGREESGKSTLLYSIAADVTRGRLKGVYKGAPKAVLIVATEDSPRVHRRPASGQEGS